MTNDTSFARLVSLACHDVRTPLATVHGFAKTLTRSAELEAPADRYVEMIAAASSQMAELLDELSLVARIEAGRYEPALREADTLALAHAAAGRARAGRRARAGAAPPPPPWPGRAAGAPRLPPGRPPGTARSTRSTSSCAATRSTS